MKWIILLFLVSHGVDRNHRVRSCDDVTRTAIVLLKTNLNLFFIKGENRLDPEGYRRRRRRRNTKKRNECGRDGTDRLNPSLGEMLLKTFKVANVGTLEAIYRLVIITHHGNVSMLITNQCFDET